MKHLVTTLFTAVIILANLKSPTNAMAANVAREPVYRTAHFDTSYLLQPPLDRPYSDFGVEYLNLLSAGFDFLGDAAFNSNFVLRFLYTGIWAFYGIALLPYATGPLELAIHEWGHGSRLGAMGYQPVMVHTGSGLPFYSFFPYFFASFGKSGGGQTFSSGSAYPSLVLNPFETGIAVTGGGTNAQTRLSQNIEERVYYYNGHILDFFPYWFGKHASKNYVERQDSLLERVGTKGDMWNVAIAYQALGYSIDTDKIRKYSNNSLYFSSTSYAYVYSLFKYVFTGDPTVHAFEIGPLKLPDTNMYLTPNGISYRISSGLRFGSVLIPLAVETIMEGAKKFEPTIGFRKSWGNPVMDRNSSVFHIEVAVGTGASVTAYYQRAFSDVFTFTVGGIYADNRTLYGIRNSWTYASNRGTELYLKIGLRY